MSKPILELKNIAKWFPVRRNLIDLLKKPKTWVKAVDTISLTVNEGEIFAIVGESGCGKTTTAKLVMKLVEPTSGSMIFKGSDITHLNGKELKKFRKNIQMIFQDPYASMNPRFKARDVIEEPMLIHKVASSRKERESLILQSLEAVRLIPAQEFFLRFPHMLSGGQRQRVTTARSLVLRPSMIVADEPVSMIDLSTRAEILAMLKSVQKEFGLTYLYITHDLSTARYFADTIAVMYLGKIVEMAPADDLIDNPQHPYTKALIAAVCEPETGRVQTIKELPIKGEIPSAANIPPGCRFHPRCIYALPQCNSIEPFDTNIAPHHQVACHLVKSPGKV
ncbi:MAG: ABC transporter ATP-binding protein [Chitinivibrionales bacterium]|nr:ABC transporter ATP-binding protein [Chitinivibrionales bacterium]